jgi:hypothetical protein
MLHLIVSEVNKSAHPIAWTLLLVYRVLILLAWIAFLQVTFFLSSLMLLDHRAGAVQASFITKMAHTLFLQLMFTAPAAPMWILPARLFAYRPMNKLEWAFLIPGVTILGFVCVRLLT